MIEDNLVKINARISRACAQAGRQIDSVTLVAVVKNRTLKDIGDLVEAGIGHIGENKVQDALVKHRAISQVSHAGPDIKWHMVGHLQTNKVKDALGIFDLIHSVDSLHLAQEIDKQAAKINKTQDVLIEVNTSGQISKFGLEAKEAVEGAREISRLKNITIKGLMTIAPLSDEPGQARPYFRMLRELRDKINVLSFTPCPLSILSMGMSDDFEVAIEEGANMVRIGQAIFED